MLLTSVYWNTSAWTLDLLKGKPALQNSKINLTNSSSLSAGVRTQNINLDLQMNDTHGEQELSGTNTKM